MMIVDNAIYVDGRRTVEPHTVRETHEAVRDTHGLAWIGLYKPTEEEFAAVAGEFGLHELAVEDAIKAHQRPKIERYGDTLFVVLKPARYLDDPEEVEFGEVHVFVGRDFVITVRHGEARPWPKFATGSRENPASCGWGLRRSSTRSWTGWWTGTRRWWMAWKTT